IRVARIRVEDAYGGIRVTLQAKLGNARLPVQVDVGAGDSVVPAPDWLGYPGLLHLPRPRLRAYKPETAIAEKLHAKTVLGEANSRMRDFFDIFVLTKHQDFGESLVLAITATFERRRTQIPNELPLALTSRFAELPAKQSQWKGFLDKNRLASVPADFSE